MADKKKDTDSKKIQPLEKEQVLSPFEDMDHWMDDFFHPGWMHPYRQRWPNWGDFGEVFKGRVPKVDVIDRENEIIIHAELPGVNKDDLDVTMTENTVSIRATTKQEKKEEKGEYFRREMSRGEFQRTIPLPVNVDAENAKASFKDGIMELKLPKVKKTKRKTIKVE